MDVDGWSALRVQALGALGDGIMVMGWGVLAVEVAVLLSAYMHICIRCDNLNIYDKTWQFLMSAQRTAKRN